MASAKNILIIKLGALGDFIQSLGPMAAIRRHHPDARMTLLTTKPYADLARQVPYIDDVWIDERPRWHQPKSWIALKQKLDKGGFQRVYDLQNSDRTALYFRLMSPKPEWVGAARGASHEHSAPSRTSGHAAEGHIETLAKAGIHDVGIDTLDWMDALGQSFDLPAPYALIVPGASPSRPLKRWPAKRFGTLCRRIHDEMGVQPVVIGREAEREAIAQIKTLCPGVIDLGMQTAVTDLPRLARQAAFAIGNDTGPMHLIAQTGCRALVLFSADSDPVRHKPLGARVHTLQKNDLGDLDVDSVFAAARALYTEAI